MPPFQIPENVPFPALAYDVGDDTLVFDLDGIRALVDANPHLGWSEDLLLLLLATWCLRDVEAGRPVGPAAAVLGLSKGSSASH